MNSILIQIPTFLIVNDQKILGRSNDVCLGLQHISSLMTEQVRYSEGI